MGDGVVLRDSRGLQESLHGSTPSDTSIATAPETAV